ncbi:hypothetical protein CNMCM6106_003389 [Aspergillus hiratsukae]|uniref:Required for respiratory growth protein 8, mitochondrial n=1 Tax=Aspergillus hiratsukae TaxID=1194566 RepID=A0A8H6PNN8_9EURO|nr:hypothetical protein CNMCM6106_003389 [Aspergillus hiratsukae]
MECFRQHASYASWRLATFRQLFLTFANPVSSNRILRRGISSSNGQDEPRIPPGESQNEADSQEVDRDDVRRNGEAPSQTAQSVRPSQLLPQSPLLTKALPRVDKKRKKRPTQSDADRLRLNPWAVALASPLRMCAVTGTRLPRDFLTEWGLVQRPDDDRLWFMPVHLLQDELSSSKVAQADRDDQADRSSPENKSLRSLRIVDHLPLLKDLTIPLARNKSGRRPLITRLVPLRWRHPLGPITNREEKLLIWREDMPEFVLQRMRKHVLKELKDMYGAQKRSKSRLGSLRIIDAKDSSYDALLEGLRCLEKIERMECGGVLVMGRQLEQHENGDSSNGQEQVHDYELGKSPYPDSVTLPQTQSRVPIFDLTELFSQADLAEVRGYGPLFENTALFLSPDNLTARQALLALWKLKAFLRPESP